MHHLLLLLVALASISYVVAQPGPGPAPAPPTPAFAKANVLSFHFLANPKSFWTFCANVYVNGSTGACNWVDQCLPGVVRLQMSDSYPGQGTFCYWDKDHLPSACYSAAADGICGNFTVGNPITTPKYPDFAFLFA